jgi:hypothetical protein
LFGFSDNAVVRGQVTPAVSAQLAKSAGANVTRTVLSWRDVEPNPGELRLTVYDSIYKASLAQGIRPVFVLVNAPRWALPSGVTCADDVHCRYAPAPEHDDAWRAFVAIIAKRYPQMAALEIWNEPNLKAFWNGPIDPKRYTDLLKQAFAAAHQVNPALPVLGGSLSNYRAGDPAVGMSYRDFLRIMYLAGARGNMDGLAMHPYPEDIDPWWFYKMLTDVREIRDNWGDSATKLWITEVGVTTTDPTNARYVFDGSSQAIMLTRLYLMLGSMPDVAATLLYTLIDPFTLDGFGIVGSQPGLFPKPAYCMLASVNHTGYVCPAGVTTQPTIDEIQALRWRAEELLQSAADAARAYRTSTRSYVGLNSTVLHAAVPQISATPAIATLWPGASADPTRVAVRGWKSSAGIENLMLCNTSQADRSYCIWTAPGAGWTYGKAEGPINAAAGSLSSGASWSW